MKEFGKVRGFYKIVKAAIPAIRKRKKLNKIKENGDNNAEKQLIAEMTHIWAEKVIDDFEVKLNVHGEENIPKEGPVVYVMNHQGYFDIFAMFALIPHQFCFVAKKEWSKIPVFKGCIEMTRGIFIDRGNPREIGKTMKQGKEYLDDGFSLAIFPEGTRSHRHEMAELKHGSFKLATRSGVPIVPVCIDGAYKVYEEKDKFVTGQTIDVFFHEPIPTAGVDRTELNVIPNRVEKLFEDDLNKDGELNNCAK